MNAPVISEAEKALDTESYVGQIVRIPTKFVKQLPEQPRTYFDPKAMQRLQESIEEIGQQSPATVIPWNDGTFRLRDGERRWRCCQKLKYPLLALVVEPRSLEEEFELSAAANMNRESHSPLEKALAMKRLRDGSLKRSVPEIARTFGVSDVTVYNHLLILDKLPPKVIELMDPNRQGGRAKVLQLTVAVHLTALKDFPDEQLRIARTVVGAEIQMAHAKRMIDSFAEKQNIQTGRGRRRHDPNEKLKELVGAVSRLHPKLSAFVEQEHSAIENLFQRTPAHRHEEFLISIDTTIEKLQELRAKVVAVENIGTKRSDAA